MIILNLGGEGEISGVINQQGPWAVGPSYKRSVDGKSFADVVAEGHVFLICPNDAIPFPDGTVDQVYTNGVPVDQLSTYGPGVQSSEIQRILKSGGEWVRDGAVHYTKP